MNIKINTEYITLGAFLKYSGIIQNGSEAKEFLAENIVLVNFNNENRRGKKLYIGDIIFINNIEYKLIK